MFAGTWVNERGSMMILEQDGETIGGRYVSQIGDEKLPALSIASSDWPMDPRSALSSVGLRLHH